MAKDKTERIFIRVSPTEKKEIEDKAAAANKTVAGYLIELSENRKLIDTSKFPALILEIRRIGVNINQIAAVANTQKYISKELLQSVKEQQKDILGLLQKILEEVYDPEAHTLQSLEMKIDRLIKAVETGGGNSGGS